MQENSTLAGIFLYLYMEKIRIGILRETKNPPDRRVPLTPRQCRELLDANPELELYVQSSDYRCYDDEEYLARGIELKDDLSDCSTLIGVKEVKQATLLPGKQYVFFSHTAKKQPYNRDLLQAVVEKKISLVDYEYLTNTEGIRVVAFGRWAGVVGAYNGFRGLGLRKKALGEEGFELKPASACFDLKELHAELKKVEAGDARFVVTGGGRVAGGALEILLEAGVRELEPEAFLEGGSSGAVFTRLDPWHYTRRKDGSDFDFTHFMKHPDGYENALAPYLEKCDVLMACHFWDPASPVMLTREHLTSGKLPLSLVADISCDIDGPIVSTTRASTIAEPFYGYDAASGNETAAFRDESLTVMAVDNLPGELPRDASADFGEALTRYVLPEIMGKIDTGMLERATIAAEGGLTKRYAYLAAYLAGKE